MYLGWGELWEPVKGVFIICPKGILIKRGGIRKEHRKREETKE